MATTMEPPTPTQDVVYTHDYHAEAHVLSGELKRPIEQNIEKHAPVVLKDRRGGHLTRVAEDISIEGLISFKTGLTRVSGSKSLKHHGWVTLSTSILEGINVFEVITADRIVGQVSTEHPLGDGHTPHVTFLGTKFENLQAGGFDLTPTFNLGICGKKPPEDRSYFNERSFLEGIRDQTKAIAETSELPKHVTEQYHRKLTHVNDLLEHFREPARRGHERKITCSLVQGINKVPIPDLEAFGHVVVIPNFGTVTLGEIEIGEKFYEDSERPNIYFELRTVKMNLGCVGHGDVQGPTVVANGHNHP
jgi:hypothetical protein